MPASDYIAASDGTGEAVRAIVTTTRLVASVTLIVDSVVNWPNKFIATSGTLDPLTGLIDPLTMTVFKGTLTGSIITIDTYAPGYSDIGHTVGQVVVLKPSTFWADTLKTHLDDLATTISTTGDITADGYLTATGANGALSLYANTDGGEFNLLANASGTLAIYGTAGNTLDVELLDGSLTVNGTASAIAQEAWIAPTLTNSWVYYGAPFSTAGYMIDSLGFVHLKGLLKSGTVNAAMFTLPAGYRPERQMIFATICNNAITRVDITTAGVVIQSAGVSNAFQSLDGIRFRAYA